MASSSFYSGTGVTAENTDVTPVAPNNITAIEDSKNAAALSEAASAASATASANSAASGASSASTATTKASESADSATASATSAAASQVSRVASEAAKVASETAKTASETARDAAASSSTAATASQAAASSSETNAATSEAAALASKSAAATSAATASVEATNSATSAAASEVSNVASGVAKVAAEAAETNAETAQAASEAARDAAAVSQAAAATSETNAASSEGVATTQAGIATTKASESAVSATASEVSRVAAAASQVASSNSQVAAASSAASAAAVFDQFDDTYLGSKTSAPTVDNDGNALVAGSLYYNSATGGMFIWSGSEWIAASAAGGASLNNFSFTASANQTTFSGSDDNSNTMSYVQDNLIVVLNGVILEAGTDYTATNGSSIILSSGAAANDELNVVAFKSFTTADMVSSSNGGTFYNNVDFSAGIDVTGNITVTGTVDGRDVAVDGALAASAVQPGDLATVATSGSFNDLSNKPSPFDPSTLATVATSGAYSDLSGKPTLGTAAATAATAYATAAQGALADSAVQPNDTPTFAGINTTGNATFGDNGKAIFGAGSDLQIYHDGSNSYIDDAGTGLLAIRANTGVYLQKYTGETLATFVADGGAAIYYDNAPKLATTSTGIDVTGRIITDNITEDTSGRVGIGRTPTSNLLEVADTIKLTNLGTGEGFIGFNTNGQKLSITATDAVGAGMKFEVGSSERMRLNSFGDWMVSNTVANAASGFSTQAGCGWVDSDTHFEIATTSNRSALEVGKNNANDGKIVTFRKQGGEVGSIGTATNEFEIKSSGSRYLELQAIVGLYNSDWTGNLQMSPTVSSVDLGNSTNQWDNAHFSGTVNAASFSGDGSNLTGISGTPAGAVIYHAANTPPTGFIKANGASLSTSTYAALFSAIGYTYGGSGGSFNVPDLRGEFIRGWDDGRGVDSGRGFGSAQSDAMRNLTGGFKFRDDDGASYAIKLSYANGVFSGVNHYGNPFNSGGSGGGQSFSSGVDFDASNQVTTAAEFRPRNVALLACIKY